MDPNVTLQMALAGNKEARVNLRDWLAKGGFGPRVESHPATDAWISGDRYGTVQSIGTKYVHVKMDRSGKVRRFTFDNVIPLW